MSSRSKEHAFQVVIPQYLEHIQLTNGRRPVYYLRKEFDKIPKKYLLDASNVFKQKGKEEALFSNTTKQFVLKNEKVRDKPRMYKINAQNLWSGINEFTRVKLRDQLHDFFFDFIYQYVPKPIVIPKDHFLHLEYEFLFPFSARNMVHVQDYLNHAFIYQKAFEDTLTDNGFLTDDSPLFLRGGYAHYTGVETEEERCLIIRGYFLTNNERI